MSRPWYQEELKRLELLLVLRLAFYPASSMDKLSIISIRNAFVLQAARSALVVRLMESGHSVCLDFQEPRSMCLLPSSVMW